MRKFDQGLDDSEDRAGFVEGWRRVLTGKVRVGRSKLPLEGQSRLVAGAFLGGLTLAGVQAVRYVGEKGPGLYARYGAPVSSALDRFASGPGARAWEYTWGRADGLASRVDDFAREKSGIYVRMSDFSDRAYTRLSGIDTSGLEGFVSSHAPDLARAADRAESYVASHMPELSIDASSGFGKLLTPETGIVAGLALAAAGYLCWRVREKIVWERNYLKA